MGIGHDLGGFRHSRGSIACMNSEPPVGPHCLFTRGSMDSISTASRLSTRRAGQAAPLGSAILSVFVHLSYPEP